MQPIIESIAFGIVSVFEGFNKGFEINCIRGHGLSLSELAQPIGTTPTVVPIDIHVVEVLLELGKVMPKGMLVIFTDVASIRSCISEKSG